MKDDIKMNLLQKTKRYLTLRKLNMPHATAKREFEAPLTEGDKLSTVVIVAVALLAITLAYAEEIDGKRTDAMSEANKHALDLVKARRALSHSESIVASMLNGSVLIDGRLRTLCVLDAAGRCV